MSTSGANTGSPTTLLLMSGIASVYVNLGLYGIYLILFTAALLCTTCRREPMTQRWLLVPLLVMFMAVTTCLALSIVSFQVNLLCYSAPVPYQTKELLVTYTIVQNIMTCLSGLCSDGLLAWRCFVIFGKRRWVKWLLTTVLLLNFLLGTLMNIAYMDLAYTMKLGVKANRHIAEVGVFWTNMLPLVWSWYIFAANTAMTFSAIYSIVRAATRARRLTTDGYTVYVTAGRVIMESSTIAWVALLANNIASSLESAYPLSHVNSESLNANLIEDTIWSILPVLLGISQTLIMVRIGLARYMRARVSVAKHTAIAFAGDSDAQAQTELIINGKRGNQDIGLATLNDQSPSV